MTSPPTYPQEHRHPWLATFLQDPRDGLASLLSGYADIFPFTRTDAPDAARLIFAALPKNDPARFALDEAASAWFEDTRRRTLPAESSVRQVRAREIVEAFEIVSELELVGTAKLMREQYVRWANWVEQYSLTSSRDARGAFWEMLARTQVAIGSSSRNPDSLVPLWLELCRSAGGALPERYLQTGILGLRRLPAATERGDVPWVAGLAAWGLAQDPTSEKFLQYWLPLKRLYPSSPGTWRKQIRNALQQRPFREAGIEPPAWWGADPDFRNLRSSPGVGTIELPSKEALTSLTADIATGTKFPELVRRLDKLSEGHRNFAERSGDDYFLARTFCNVGSALIKIEDEEIFERSRYAESLAREVISYQPFDLFAWSLWRDTLVARGELRSAATLSWEMVRRFPESQLVRGILIDLLAKRLGALEEAELLARDTVYLFPDHPYPRPQLAELLIGRGKFEEVPSIVQEALKHNPQGATYELYARVLDHEGNAVGARAALETGLALEPENPVLRLQLAKFENGKPLTLVSHEYREATAPLTHPEDSTLVGVLRDGQLRQLRQRVQVDDTALVELRTIFEDDPTVGYAQLLAARYGLWRDELNVQPSVGAAFEIALREKDGASLSAIATRRAEFAPLVLAGKALLGDREAAEQLSPRLESAHFSGHSRATAILRERLRPILQVISGGGAPGQAILDDLNRVQQAIYDANEALSATRLVAA